MQLDDRWIHKTSPKGFSDHGKAGQNPLQLPTDGMDCNIPKTRPNCGGAEAPDRI